jgi:uncharacterized protein (TIRG00374 family)
MIWKKKSLWLSIAVLLILCGATVYVLHRELNGQDIWGTLLHADIKWFAAAVAFMLMYFVLDGLNIARCLELSGHKITFAQKLKYAFAGFFFSSITPSSTGGQPGQLYFMAKDGIKVHHGAFSLLCTLLSFQIISVTWGIVGAFFAPHGLWNLDGKYSYVFPIGFALNLAIILMLICVLFSRKMACFFACAYMKLPGKKPTKPGDRFACLRSFAGYRRAANLMRRNKSVFLKMLLNSFVEITIYFSVPFLCARALGASNLDWFSGICTQGALFLSVSSLPLPGAAGVTEYGYALFFDGLIPMNILGSALLLSRFCNFVLPLAESGIGLIILQLKQKRRRAMQ